MASVDFWSQLGQAITPHLGEDDDPSLWIAAINCTFHDATFLARCSPDSALVSASIGCCSHWLRPHQTRWTADGGFAWPSGYGGYGFSRRGLPEHDWTADFIWNSAEQLWESTMPGRQARHDFGFNVTVPARTARHRQAAIPVTWPNGSPALPQTSLFQIYGFRNLSSGWQCTATNNAGAKHYELAADRVSHESV